jgi:hypothetical protein
MDLSFLIKQMMPPDFDMDKAMAAVKDVATRLVRTDERTVTMLDTLQRIETQQARILALLEAKDNG